MSLLKHCFRSYEDALAYFYTFHRDGLPAAARAPITVALAHQLGADEPLKSDRIWQITGTNGKGSTGAYLNLFATSTGHKTIWVSSPHMNSVRERIRLDGVPLSKGDFVELMERATPVLERARATDLHPPPTTIIVLLALLAHTALGPNAYGIYEVGSGGLRDSTNVFPRSIVGLTSVAEDHLEQFGGTLESLMIEKLGLCSPGGTLVYQQQRQSLGALLENYCCERSIGTVKVCEIDRDEMRRGLNGVMLSGEWQADNAALAYRMFAQLHEAELGKVASSVGTRRAFIAGRLEERSWQHGTVLLDGAHNVPAVECLLRHLTLTRPPGAAKWIGVVGISCTKDWRQMLDRVAAANIFEAVVVTRATRPRGVDPAELSEYISGIACVPIISHPSLRSTLVWARARAHRKLLIFGSLLLLADFDRALHAIGCGRDAAPIEELDPEQPWMLPLC